MAIWLIEVDLSFAQLEGADLFKMMLAGADLSGANLQRATLDWSNLNSAKLNHADLRFATLSNASLAGAQLGHAKLSNADLSGANITDGDFFKADLKDANLTNTIIEHAQFVEADLEGANLEGSWVYGVNVWNTKLTKAFQKNLRISRHREANLTVDNLGVAQFIYLLLHSEQVRSVIDTIVSKVVLILGRFSPERKIILEAIKDELRKRNYLPVLCDFDAPVMRDLTETISILAHIARFVIADITDAKSVPQELMRIVPALPSVPVQPILLASQREYGMFDHFRRFPWVLEPFFYSGLEDILASIGEKILSPSENRLKKLAENGDPQA